MSRPGIFRPPPPVNEPVTRLRARLARARRAAAAARRDAVASGSRSRCVIGGEEVRTGDTVRGGHAARQGARPRRRPQGRRRPRSSRRSRPPPRPGRTGTGLPWEERAAVFLRAAELLAGPWRSTLERRDDARPVEDRAPGRDRRGLRADRLLALQRRVHDAGSTRSSRSPRRASGTGWSTGRSRASSSRSRRSTSPRSAATSPASAGADGQHGRLEAGLDRGLLRATTLMQLLRGGGPAARRDQPRLRPRRRRSATPRSRARTSPASTSPARPRSSRRCGRRSARTSTATATTRASSARPAARTSSSPTRPPTSTRSRPRSCAARSSTRARSARPPRASTRPSNLWPELRERLVEEVAHDQDGRRRRLRELHGRRDRRAARSRRRRRRSRRRSAHDEAEVLVGGGTDDSEGYFVEPTVIETTRPATSG